MKRIVKKKDSAPEGRHSGKPGSALLYVLFLGLILVLLSSAVFYRFINTVRCLTHDESYVRAQFLADSGLSLVIALLQNDYEAWENAFPIQSEKLGSRYYSQSELMGSFTVDRYVNNNVAGNARGSFITLVSTGRSGSRISRTAATVKVTNPLLNFLYISDGDLTIYDTSTTLIGPIYVSRNEETNGDFRLMHDSGIYDEMDQRWEHRYGDPQLDIQVKAHGDIYLRSYIQPGCPIMEHKPGIRPMYFEGTTPKGIIFHDDITVTEPTQDPDKRGHLDLLGNLEAEPHLESNIKINTIDELMQSIRESTSSNKIEIHVPPRNQTGVLAEFTNGHLYVSEARTRQLGYIFDKDVYENDKESLIGFIGDYYRNHDTADGKLQKQVVWDDPDYENIRYPSDLEGDLDGDGTTETTGDAMPVRRIVRGPLIRDIALNNEWKTVYIVAPKADYPINGADQAPPLFVRGNVDGKVILAYDVANDSLDPDYSRLHTIILAEHEAPEDVIPALKKAPPGLPGVPGGIRYQDDNYMDSPEKRSYTGDSLILICRGSINVSGDTGYNKIVRTSTGLRLDYGARLKQLDTAYKNSYLEKYGDIWDRGDYTMYRPGNILHNVIQAPMHGVFISQSSHSRFNHLAADGTVIPENINKRLASKFNSAVRWEAFGEYPEGGAGALSDFAFFPVSFRMANAPDMAVFSLKGTLSSLGSPLETFGGTSYFDYQYQGLNSAVIQDMGLPLTVIVCSWQRL